MTYVLSFHPKLMKHIRKANNILNKNKRNVDIGRKRVKMLKDPKKDPKINRNKDAFLFNVLLTVRRRRKSNHKLRKKTKSKYTVIFSPSKLYKKEKKKLVDLSYLNQKK